jgi:two-component system KDP operon response regulator KdpE
MLFETNGFRVVSADSCELGIRQAQTHRPDVCIVDLGLPDSDGLHFIQRIWVWSPVAIIVLTARVAELQQLSAFEASWDRTASGPRLGQLLLAHVQAEEAPANRGRLLEGAVST